jgi:hypothetical protein
MPYATCLYVGRAGVCGKACWAGHKDGDRCGVHRNRESLTWCGRGCGRATNSRTGFCNKCGWAQNDRCKQLRIEAARLESYIDEVLSWDWTAPQCLTARETRLSAAAVIGGSVV